jgi:hypothetical protein
MAIASEYTRLPGRGYAYLGFGRSSLWLGPDHLLLINRRGYTEEYKRFYYRDIRALVIRNNGKYSAWNIVLGSITGMALLILAMGYFVWDWELAVLMISSIFVVPFLLILIFHLAKGPTCSTHLYTAVHAEELPSMNRTTKSLKVMRMIGSRIEATQGTLSRGQLLIHPGAEIPPQFQRPVQSSPPEPISSYKGTFHLGLFFILVLDAAQTSLSIFNRSSLLQITNLIAFLALWTMSIAALFLQRRSRLTSGLKGITWGTFCYLGLMLMLSYVYSMIVMFQNPAAAGSQWGLAQAVWKASPLESPVLLAITLFSIAGSLSLGLAGLIAWLRFKKNSGNVGARSSSEPVAGGVQ